MSLDYREKAIKQVFIYETMAWGGAEMLRKTFTSFVQHNAECTSKFDITIICLTSKGAVAEMLEKRHGVRVISMQWQEKLPAWSLMFKLRSLLLELQPDVVHTCLFEAHRHGVLAARLAGCSKVVLEEHGDNCWMGWRERWVSRIIALFAVKVLAVSHAHAEHLINYMPYSRNQLMVLKNCIDTQRFTRKRERKRSKSNIVSFVTVGSLIEVKNIPLLLNAFALLIEKLPESRLSIVGEGELKDQLVSMAYNLGLHDKVEFLGVREDIGSILKEADIYVHAGHDETFCIAMAEAMYSGCGCVAPDCEVFRELTDDGRVALLVEADNPIAMAEGLLSLAQNEEARILLGSDASEYAAKEFHPMRYTSDLLRLYRNIELI